MKNHPFGGKKLSLLLVLPALACSTSSGRRRDPADATVQEVREDTDEIPCEPRLVLQTICQQCHSAPTKNGAPFSLVRRSDVLTMRGDMIAELEAKRMPLTPVTIAPDARQVLLDWLKSGAPAVTPRRCDAVDAGEPDAEADASDGSAAADGCADARADADAGTVIDGGSDAADAADE